MDNTRIAPAVTVMWKRRPQHEHGMLMSDQVHVSPHVCNKSQASVFWRELEKKTDEQRKTLPAGVYRASYHLPTRLRSFSSFYRGIQSASGTPPPLEAIEPVDASVATSSILELSSPSDQLTAGNDYFGDVPRLMSSGLDSVLKPLEQAIPLVSQTEAVDVSRDVGPRFPLGSLVETQRSSHECPSTPAHPSLSPSGSDPTSIHSMFQLAQRLWPHETSSTIDAMAKDPEALLDTHSFKAADVSRTEPSIMVTALITALGLLTSHSSNPKVAIFQLSAAAVSFTLIALHSFRSKTLVDTEQHSTFVQRLLEYFPLLIFASCWILFLLSITFASPKAMAVTIFLVVFASVPMACGARLPAALTLAIIILFSLTFLALVFLVCILPAEWLA